MQRRTLLVGSGTVVSTLIAGCASDQTEDIDGGTRDDDSGGNGGDGGSDGGDNSDGSGNGGGSTGSADLEIGDHEMVINEGQFSTHIYVEAIVENTGDAPSGDVDLQVDWYDSEGNYLNNSTGRLISLGDGETWATRVYYLGMNGDKIADYELSGEFSEDAYEPAEGLSLVDSSMDVTEDSFGDSQVVVEGRVSNESGEDQSYVEVVAKIYDGDGNVLGDNWTNVTDLRDGETWAFSFDYFPQEVNDRADEAADHEILVKDSSW